MAVWIWSMAMARAWESGVWDTLRLYPERRPDADAHKLIDLGNARVSSADGPLIPARSYLQSDLPRAPLPNDILDRLADLYWTEREGTLAL
ncbi:MAG: hypothetical protein QM780_06530 [Hyphomicrobium sp.]|uniref:hypothetical protein n=1 Tax=Hyphomicrobium sp. TaxID=82 RepID=UPI0039E27396